MTSELGQSSAQAALASPDIKWNLASDTPASPNQTAIPAASNEPSKYLQNAGRQSTFPTLASNRLLRVPSRTLTNPSSSASALYASECANNSEAHVHLSSEILRTVLTEYDHIVFSRLSCFDASLGQFAEHLVQVRHEIVGTMNAMLDDYSIAAETKFTSNAKRQSRFIEQVKLEMGSWRSLLDESMKSAVRDGLAEAIRTSEANHDEVLKRMSSMFLLILDQSKQTSDCICTINKSLKAAGTSIDSMDAGFNERLETIENLVLGRTVSASITATPNRPGFSFDSEASRSLTTSEADIRERLISSPDVLAQLLKTVSVARDEAHSGTEELAAMLEVAHELQKGRLENLQEQIRDLRSELGLEDAHGDQCHKSPTEGADEAGTMSTSRKRPSLSNRVSDLEQDVKEALRLLRVLVANSQTNAQIDRGESERESYKSSVATKEVQCQTSSQSSDVTMVEQHSDAPETFAMSQYIRSSPTSSKRAATESFEPGPIDDCTSPSPQLHEVDEQRTPVGPVPLPAWENLSIHVWEDGKDSGEEDSDINGPSSASAPLEEHPLDIQTEEMAEMFPNSLPMSFPFQEHEDETDSALISSSIPGLFDHEEMHAELHPNGFPKGTEALTVISSDVEPMEPTPVPSAPESDISNQIPTSKSLTLTPTDREPQVQSNRRARSSSFPSLEELIQSTKPKKVENFDLFSDSSLTPLSSPASSSCGSDSSDTSSEAEDHDETLVLPARRVDMPSNGDTRENGERPKKRRKLTDGTESHLIPKKPKRKSKHITDLKQKSTSHSSDTKWAVRTEGGDVFNRQMVQCDLCRNFYHFRCAGLKKGDPEVEMDDAPYNCPPCCRLTENGTTVEIANSDAEEVCRRPDCDVSDAPEFYVVEKVLGRALAETANGKVVVIWLVKWEGYPMDACAWEPTKNLEGSKRLLKDFYRQAKLEGRDWRKNDTVILKEAFDGGYSL